MKTLNKILISCILVSSFASAEEFTFQYERTKTQKIDIVEKNGMKMNQACAKNFNACDKAMNKKSIEIKKLGTLKGNPASLFCREKQGEGLIYKDSKNNEYDFCRFENTYDVDSWDLYRRFNNEKN